MPCHSCPAPLRRTPFSPRRHKAFPVPSGCCAALAFRRPVESARSNTAASMGADFKVLGDCRVTPALSRYNSPFPRYNSRTLLLFLVIRLWRARNVSTGAKCRTSGGCANRSPSFVRHGAPLSCRGAVWRICVSKSFLERAFAPMEAAARTKAKRYRRRAHLHALRRKRKGRFAPGKAAPVSKAGAGCI